MALVSDITSWTSLGMDWSNPDPYSAKYTQAIYNALMERLIIADAAYSVQLSLFHKIAGLSDFNPAMIENAGTFALSIARLAFLEQTLKDLFDNALYNYPYVTALESTLSSLSTFNYSTTPPSEWDRVVGRLSRPFVSIEALITGGENGFCGNDPIIVDWFKNMHDLIDMCCVFYMPFVIERRHYEKYAEGSSWDATKTAFAAQAWSFHYLGDTTVVQQAVKHSSSFSAYREKIDFTINGYAPCDGVLLVAEKFFKYPRSSEDVIYENPDFPVGEGEPFWFINESISAGEVNIAGSVGDIDTVTLSAPTTASSVSYACYNGYLMFSFFDASAGLAFT